MVDEETKENYELYKRRRNFLIDLGREASRSYDKYILTLAAGTFGLSLLFIENVTKGNIISDTKWCLVSSWVAFGVSILSTLLSFLCGQEASSKEIEILDKEFETGKTDKSKIRERLANFTKWLNRSSMVLFIIGVIFLIIFSSQNLK